MKVILDFLFGKFPKIFTEKGEVQHHLNPHVWKLWKKRYKEGFEYNWRQHKGMRLENSVSSSSSPPRTDKVQK